jgi:uncharacterized protein
MNCPKCSGAMERINVGEIEVDRCPGCHGLWFDLREHEHLKEVKDSEKLIDSAPSSRTKDLDAMRGLTCPRCKGRLVRLAAPEQPHVKYDQCHTCGGAFFDAGEFTDYKNLTFVERVLSVFPGARRSRKS